MRFAPATLAFVLLASGAGIAHAAEPTFKLDIKDGVITPSQLEVPANTRFRLEITNSGKSPAEFESVPLKKEKVIGGGNTSVIVIRGLDAGSYEVFDDFHVDLPHAKIIAK